MSSNGRDLTVSISVGNLKAHLEELLRRYKYLADDEDLVDISIDGAAQGFVIPDFKNVNDSQTVVLRYKSEREEATVIRPW